MNGTRDIVFKRCGCTDQVTGRQLVLRRAGHHRRRAQGPRPARRARHPGRRHRRPPGHPRRPGRRGRGRGVDGGAVAAVLARASGTAPAPSTLHGYRDHIDRYLVPSVGRITLADLTGKRLQAGFSLLSRQRTRNGCADRRVHRRPGPGYLAVGAECRRP
jgi:hypothetical protein